MTERGPIITSAIHDPDLRKHVAGLMENMRPNHSATVCLSVVATPRPLAAEEEVSEARCLANEVADYMKTAKVGHYVDLVAIPEWGEITVFRVYPSGEIDEFPTSVVSPEPSDLRAFPR